MKKLEYMWNELSQANDYDIDNAEIILNVYHNPPKCDTIGGLPEGFFESIEIGQLIDVINEIRYMPTFEESVYNDAAFHTPSITRAAFFESANLSLIANVVWDNSKSQKKNTFL